MRRIVLLFICLLLLSCHNKLSLTDKPQSPGKPELLKQYAFCSCIKAGYKQDTLLQQDISPTIYQELSDYSITMSVARQLDSLAINASDNIKPSQVKDYEGRKAIMFHCMQFYHSSRLDSLVNIILGGK